MRRLLIFLLVALVLMAFLLMSEDKGIPLANWIRDPDGSAARHAVTIEAERQRAASAAAGEVAREDGAGRARPDGGGLGQDLSGDPTRSPSGAEWAPRTFQPNAGLIGRVRDLDGRGVAGMVVSYSREDEPVMSALSDDDGHFQIDASALDGALRVDTRSWVLLGGDERVTPLRARQLEVFVAPRLDVGGRVRDAAGHPLPDVEVYGYAPVAAAAPRDVSVDLPPRYEVKTRSDAEGNFHLEGLPRLPFTRVELSRQGFKRLRFDAPAANESALELVLEPAQEDSH